MYMNHSKLYGKDVRGPCMKISRNQYKYFSEILKNEQA